MCWSHYQEIRLPKSCTDLDPKEPLSNPDTGEAVWACSRPFSNRFAKDSLASQVTLVVKNPPANAGRRKRHGFDPWVRKIPGGGNGNPFQYSCLENPMDKGACSPRGCKESDMTEAI